MATSTKLFLFVSWLLSLCGKSLSGISWSCPSDEMVSSEFGCYLFHTGLLTFEDSEAYCWSVGASLLWVKGHDEMVFLAGQALQMPQVTAWMIGLHTTSVEKDLNLYFWSSGHKVTFTAWSDIEPDHYGNERCVTMELKFGYRWATVSCDEQRSFICKSDPPFFRLKNPILLGIMGVISILLIILIFILCTMRNRPHSCEEHGASCNKERPGSEVFVLSNAPSQPSAPPVDDRYTTLPSAGPGHGPVPGPPVQYVNPNNTNEPADHIYEDVDGQGRISKSLDTNTLQASHPTNPYLMWA